MKEISETNLTAGTHSYCLNSHGSWNSTIQYRLVSGDATNTVEIKFYGTLSLNCDMDDLTEWVDITDLLTGDDVTIAENSTVHDLAITDTQMKLVGIRIDIIVTGETPNNSVRIYYE